MRRVLYCLLAISLIGSPLQAAPIEHSGDEMRFGAFAGGRISIPIGGGASRRTAKAGLALAPTQTRLSPQGYVKTRIGEGLALEFGARRPQVTLAGRRADITLGLTPAKNGTGEDPKLGLSTGAAIGIGVAVALGVAAAIYLSQDCNLLNENECSE